MGKLSTLFLSVCSVFCCIVIHGQPCDKDISTNPTNPTNPPFATTYPDLINPWLNTFDISAVQSVAPPVAKNIELNKNVIWQIPDWNQNIPLQMYNPFTSSGTPYSRYNYLWNNNAIFSESDFQWEDGWELLYLGTGYFPNGEEVNLENPSRIYSNGTTTMENPKVPYIILYNRYRGTMRVFMNLFAPFGPYDNLSIRLRFADDFEISGILRHLEVIDRPLDQTTNINSIQSFNPNSGGINRWFSADFQMGYDPCDCGSGKQIRFDVTGIDTLNISLYGRAMETEIPLMENGQPAYDEEWLSLHNVSGGVSGGNRIYTKFDGLINDYKADLTRYEQLSAQYEDYQNRKDILDGIKDFVVDGVAGAVPGAGSLTNWFLKPKQSDPAETSSGMALLKGNSKGLLGWGYDMLSSNLAKGVSEPHPPSMPTASYSEMRFAGTITSTSEPVVVGPFYVPGAFDETSVSGNLTAFNYPAYNEPMGLVALLNTPSAKIEFDRGSSVTLENVTSTGCLYDRVALQRSHFEFRVKLDEELKLAYNENLDFDFDQTQSYGGIEIEMKVPNNPSPDFVKFNNFLGYTINNSEQNIFVNLDYNSDGDRIVRLNSKWVPFNLLNQYVFSLKRRDVFHFLEMIHIPPDGSDCPEYEYSNFHNFNYNYEITSVKLKLIHDMYFDQIGSSGETVNTTQIFSYYLFNDDENINLFGTDPEYWHLYQPGVMDQYRPGIMSLAGQTIGSSSSVVKEIAGSDLYIRAEKVRIHGDIEVAPGYNIHVEALDEIEINPGAILGSDIHLQIRRDFYALPEFHAADEAEIHDFCQSATYQADLPTQSLKRRMDNISRPADTYRNETYGKNTVSIHPNPVRSQTWVTSSTLPISEIQIFDLSGRILIQQKTDGPDLSRVSVDVASLRSGVYIIQVVCGEEYGTQKLVISK